MGTDKLKDSLPPGTYKVYLGGAELGELVPYARGAGGTGGLGMRHAITPLIDPKYANQDTSGLSFVVDGKTRKFDIQVDRALIICPAPLFG
ncbi:MAG: hypothetical protein FWH27_18385 [Planctomycetaceae bacterium]|nr:hypothetical protein [Planctomycetaceae bacterium]